MTLIKSACFHLGIDMFIRTKYSPGIHINIDLRVTKVLALHISEEQTTLIILTIDYVKEQIEEKTEAFY